MKKIMTISFWSIFAIVAFVLTFAMGIIGAFVWLLLAYGIFRLFVWIGRKFKTTITNL